MKMDGEEAQRSARASWFAQVVPAKGDSERERQLKLRELLKILAALLIHKHGPSVRGDPEQLQLQSEQAVSGQPELLSQLRAPPGSGGITQEHAQASSGWRSAVRGSPSQKSQKRRRTAVAGHSQAAEPSPALKLVNKPAAVPPQPSQPQPAAAEQPVGEFEGDDTAAEELHTPFVGRMLPGSGRAATARQHRGSSTHLVGAGGPGSGGGAGGGDTSALPSSSGIPTTSTCAAAAGTKAWMGDGEVPGRRRRRLRGPTEPALASGRLPLCAGGFLSSRGRHAEGAGAPAIPAAAGSAGGQQQQPGRGRQWALQQAAGPLARMLRRGTGTAAEPSQQQHPEQTQQQLLLDGSCFQAHRPTRFAPNAAPAEAAPVNLTTQIAPSQKVRAPLNPAQQQQAEQRLLGPVSDVPGATQQQQSAAEQTTQPQLQEQEGKEEEQQQQQMAAAPAPPVQVPNCHQTAAAASTQQRQPPLQQQQQAEGQQACIQPVGRPAEEGRGTLAGVIAEGTSVWTLHPTPSFMYSFSPDSPATAAGAAGRAGARTGGPGCSSLKLGQPGSRAGAGGAAPTSTKQARNSEQRPASIAAAAEAGRGVTLRRASDSSCAAEMPQLLFASPGHGSQAGQQTAWRQQVPPSTEGEARQLFVAETLSDAAPGGAHTGARSGAWQQQEAAERQQLRQAAAAAAACLADAAEAAAAVARGVAPVARPAATPSAAAGQPGAGAATAAPATSVASAPAAAQAAAHIVGLHLQLPGPVLQALPCADGRHMALLLGSYAPAGEPQHVLVLSLPAGPAAAAAGVDGPALAEAGAALASAQELDQGQEQPGGASNSCSGVQVVASVAVERSKWGQDVALTPNCLQLASTARSGLQLILSAALQLADQPHLSDAQPAILVLSLSVLGGGSSSVQAPPGAAGAAPLPRAGRRRQQNGPPGLLAIESKYPLTCVALAGDCQLFASGDGPGVHRLDFDPLWRSYTWAHLPPAYFRAVHFEDLVQLLPYFDLEQPERHLLLGISSGGKMALWDTDRSQLLAVAAHPNYHLRSLHPVSMQQAGFTPSRQRVVATGAGAAGAGAPAAAAEPAGQASRAGPHFFVGLVEHCETGRRHVAAVVLTAGTLLISGSAVRAPAGQDAAAPAVRRQQQVTAMAMGPGSRCCWLGTAAGELVAWDQLTGTGRRSSGLPPQAAAAAAGAGVHRRVQACSSRRAITSICAVHGGGQWSLVAGTEGGSCMLLARA